MTLADPILPNDPDPFAAKRAEIDAALAKQLEGADIWEKRGELTEAEAERANDFLSGATKLLRQAEAACTAERAPHMEAAKEVSRAWEPIISRLTKIIAIVKPKCEAALKAKEKRQREAAAEAARKAAEAEDAARAAAADAAAAASASARIEAEAQREAQERIAAEQAAKAQRLNAPARVQSATGLARTRSLSTKREPVIVSMAMALAHYKAEPELTELILKFASRDLRAAPTVRGQKRIPQIPGIRWEETQVLT